MARSTQNISGIQHDIFQNLDRPLFEAIDEEDFDLQHELRGACAQALKLARRRGKSRERVVDEMNALLPNLKKPITKRKLDSWMAESREDHEWPARFIPLLCHVCECDLPLRVMANQILMDLADQRDRYARRLGELEIETSNSNREKQQIKNLLRG